MTNRKDEAEKVWFRADRIFKADENYFFTTREGANVGPFNSKKAANDGMPLFLNLMQQKYSVEYAAKVAVEGNWKNNLEC